MTTEPGHTVLVDALGTHIGIRVSSDELAARIRDQLGSVRKAIERQQMVASREEDFDLLGIEEDALEASVQVFYVRNGRVVGRKGLVVDKVEDVEPPALVARIVEQLYADAPTVPKEILVPVEPEDHELYEEFLSHNRGSKVRIRVPQRGGKRELLATATLNAKEAFARDGANASLDEIAKQVGVGPGTLYRHFPTREALLQEG